MIAEHGETLLSPAPQPMGDDDDTCQTTTLFGIMKDRSLWILSLASFNGSQLAKMKKSIPDMSLS